MSDSDTSSAGDERTVKTDYIKSNFFRVVHVDGVFGGITPRGDLHVDLYSERQPIPTQCVYAINEDGSLGAEKRAERVSRKGFVREVEVGLVIDIELAKALIAWLQSKVDEYKKLTDDGK